MNARIMQLALPALAVMFLLSIVNGGNEARTRMGTTSYSQFLEDVRSNQVREVTIDGQEIRGEPVDGTSFETVSPDDPGLVADLVNNGVNIQAVPPRQSSLLGVTLFLPERHRFSASKRRLESQITTLFGGRLAEELIFGHDAVTTGAQNDIERATAIARDMVTKWGLTEGLGPLAYQESEGEVLLGQAVTQRKQISDETARQIDEEIRAVVERNYAHARTLLTENLDMLHAMADALMRYETLDAEQIDDLMAGREPRPPEGPDDRRGNAPRPESGAGARPHPTGIPAPQSFARETVSHREQA